MDMAESTWLFVLLTTFSFYMSGDCNSVPFSTFNVESGSQLYQVEVSRTTGHVYVGGQNTLLHLTPNLQPVNEFTMGPEPDSPLCPPVTPVCNRNKTMTPPVDTCNHTRTMRDNNIKVLEINTQNQEEYLLVCGTIKQGLCSIHTPGDVKYCSDLEASILTNYLGTENSTVAFFSSSENQSGILFTAMGYDGRLWDFFPKTISTRKITDIHKPEITYWRNKGNTHSYLGISKVYKDLYRVRYIAGFEYGGYTYFIAVRIKDPSDRKDGLEYITKIIQICQNDSSYSSYTEIPLLCNERTDYNLAISAFVSKSTDDDASHTLYVSFGKNSDSSSDVHDSSEGSVICAYSLQDVIIPEFMLVQTECYRHAIGYKPAWISSIGTPCTPVSCSSHQLKL